MDLCCFYPALQAVPFAVQVHFKDQSPAVPSHNSLFMLASIAELFCYSHSQRYKVVQRTDPSSALLTFAAIRRLLFSSHSDTVEW